MVITIDKAAKLKRLVKKIDDPKLRAEFEAVLYSKKSTVYAELTKLVDLPYTGGDPTVFYLDLAEKVSLVPEPVWDRRLSDASKLWYNKLIVCIQERKQLPDIPGGLPTV